MVMLLLVALLTTAFPICMRDTLLSGYVRGGNFEGELLKHFILSCCRRYINFGSNKSLFLAEAWSQGPKTLVLMSVTVI
jgi:hypothetical protein